MKKEPMPPSSRAEVGSHSNNKSNHIRVVARIRPINEDETNRANVIHPVLPEAYQPAPKKDVKELSSPPRSTRKGPLAFLTPTRKKRSNGLGSFPSSQRRAPHDDITPVIRNTQRSNATSMQGAFYPQTKNDLEYGRASSLTAKDKRFDFDAVLGPEASQQEVYERSVGDTVVQNVFRGYSTTIFIYGQTGSGKTFTMQGRQDAETLRSNNNVMDVEDSTAISCDGIIPRAVNVLFKVKQHHDSVSENKFTIQLTYLEIYNDEMLDLLADPDDPSTPKLKLCDGGENGVIVKGLTSLVVNSAEKVKELMRVAASRRSAASTTMNMRSSRSHSICSLLVSLDPTSASNANGNHLVRAMSAKLTFVDLAGSERIKETSVLGMHQQESINVNKDLFVLGKVISALSERCSRGISSSNTHVPYRDSKLTHLLRDSLGGNCHTVMIACVSPAEKHFDESMNTLRYAERARAITNSVRPNLVRAQMTPTECAAMRGENEMLKSRVNEMQTQIQFLQKPQDTDGVSFACSSVATDMSVVDTNNAGEEKKEDDRDLLDVKKLTLSSLDLEISEKEELVEQLKAKITELESSIVTNANGSNPQENKLPSTGSSSRGKLLSAHVSAHTKIEMVDLSKATSGEVVQRASFLSSQAHRKHAPTNVEENKNILYKRNEELSQESAMQKLMIDALLLREKDNEEKVKALLLQLQFEQKRVSEHETRLAQVQRELRLATEERDKYHMQVGSRLTQSVATKAEFSKERLAQIQQALRSVVNERDIYQQQAAGQSNQIAAVEAELIAKDEQLQSEQARCCEYEDRLAGMKKDLHDAVEERDNYRMRNAVQADEIKKLKKLLATKEDQPVEIERLRTALKLLAKQSAEMAEESDEKENSNMKEPPPQKSEVEASEKRSVLSTRNDHVVTQVKTDASVPEPKSVISEANDSVSCNPASAQDHPNDDSSIDTGGRDSRKSDHNAIRIQAAKMLFWANKAIERGRGSESTTSSIASSNGTEYRPDLRNIRTMVSESASIPRAVTSKTPGKPPLALPSPRKTTGEGQEAVISNLHRVKAMNNACSCNASILSGNPQHVEFYLPKLGMACSCGKQEHQDLYFNEGEDPLALTNILRSWQVEFLKSVGIKTAPQLVKVYAKKGDALAKKMRKWRKVQNLPSVKTKSCGIALHIWYRTSKSVIQSVQKQLADGVTSIKRPGILEVSVSDNRTAVSSLGCGSTFDLGSHIEL